MFNQLLIADNRAMGVNEGVMASGTTPNWNQYT